MRGRVQTWDLAVTALVVYFRYLEWEGEGPVEDQVGAEVPRVLEDRVLDWQLGMSR